MEADEPCDPFYGRLPTWLPNWVHMTLTPQIAELLEAEVAADRFANLSEALRNAAWKVFAEDPAAELRARN